MEFGAHLPLMDFGGHPYTLQHLVDYTKTAARSGSRCSPPTTTLSSTCRGSTGRPRWPPRWSTRRGMTLATTVALAVVRGPVPVAKTLGAIDRLSGGRMLVVVGPGSSARDYESVGLDFEERWARLDEAVQALRSLWGRGSRTVRRPLLLHGRDAPRAARPRSREARRSGSEAGGRMRGYGASPAWVTGGWRRRTTPRLRCLPMLVPASMIGWRSTARTPTRSRTGSPRCGSTSRRIAPRRIASFGNVWCRRSTVPRRCCASVFPSARRRVRRVTRRIP